MMRDPDSWIPVSSAIVLTKSILCGVTHSWNISEKILFEPHNHGRHQSDSGSLEI